MKIKNKNKNERLELMGKDKGFSLPRTVTEGIVLPNRKFTRDLQFRSPKQ